MFRTSQFERLVEKCTSQLLLETDWQTTMMLCDSIRSGDTNPKYAVQTVKKRFYNPNPHVAFFSLQLMESFVKNCGSLIHNEIATKDFMEELRDLVKQTKDESMRNKVLEMIQTWGYAFEKSPKYKICWDTFNVMKAEGWKFPPVKESKAMFEADTAPEWASGNVCHRCRVAFGFLMRQHHCRACGEVFCAKCSAKTCYLSKYGIEKDVRVCDSCYDEHGPKETSLHSSPAHQKDSLPAEYLASSLAHQSQEPKSSGKSESEIKEEEEEELQLALAISKSEAEEKEKKTQYTGITKKAKQDDLDPELMRYLDRDYWENKDKKEAVKTTSPTRLPDKQQQQQQQQPLDKQNFQQMSPPNNELDEFVVTLKTQVEIFVNRMKSNSSRGRSITNDSSVQTLFMNTMSMHSKLLKYIEAQEDKRVFYEGLQDKLAQVKDARAALDALREEERERKRLEAEEAERIRHAQMKEKLEVMRQKKQEYLQYQRQLALQRMQEQEREMHFRQEQAKQQYMGQQQQWIWQQPQQPYYPPYDPNTFSMQNVAAALPSVHNVAGHTLPYNPAAMAALPHQQQMMSPTGVVVPPPSSSSSQSSLQQEGPLGAAPPPPPPPPPAAPPAASAAAPPQAELISFD